MSAKVVLRSFAISFSVAVLGASPAAHAQVLGPCDPPIRNPIVCENSRPGSPPGEWDISGAGDPSLQGFATDISVNKGETVTFKVATDASNYRLDVYRLGYYGGLGARKVATVSPSATLPQTQPACLEDLSSGLVDCGNWAVSATWAVPSDAVSGIYAARLVRPDTGGASHVIFIVRDDTGGSDMLFQTADTTWQAYNSYGGNSLYVGSPAGRAFKVSYNRPINTRGVKPQNSVFNAEYPMVRWLEANGYNVSYFTNIDTERRGTEILEHKVFLSVGHDEYWSATQRANVEAARDLGIHLAFFSGNEVFWKTRWEPSIDGSGTPYRTLVSYKETHANAKIDPTPVWTGTWRDPRFSPPADGGRPENALTGTIFMVNDGATSAIAAPEPFGKLRFWRNTRVAALAPGQTATLPFGTLGYEWDEDLDNGFRPAGLFRLSSTTLNVPVYLLDYGSTYGLGTATHNLTLYRARSGALVFGGGTVQWSWGLDSQHDFGPSATDPAMQQATVNLFADMGVQPATLQPGLVAATASTDSIPPASMITSPAPGSVVQTGTHVTVTGTAADAGGVVAAVEVSVDSGTTWHLATGRENWSYTWMPQTPGQVVVKSRAVDDSGNLEQLTSGATILVVGGSAPRTCPCSIWNDSVVPTVASQADAQPVEVGVRFRSSSDGYITGLRFYKGPTNTGTHVGKLWTSTGTLLSSVIFTGESASGWQQVKLPRAVVIRANTTYVASYHTDAGGYAVDQGYFATAGVDNAPLRALRDGEDGPNGVYQYGPDGFPTQTFGSSNYWVDVVFETTRPPQETIEEIGPPPLPRFCPCRIWDDAATPIVASRDDTQPVEVGLRFRSDTDGYITGLRFYKGPANNGTHVAKLWTNAGTLLASATFSNESASGWQQVNLASPVAIRAGTTYLASYHTNVGGYAADDRYFATSGVDKPPLRALRDGEDGANGIFLYGPGGFPTESFNSSNYWVDVVFDTIVASPDTTPPTAPSNLTATAVSTSQIDLAWTASTDNMGVTGYRVERCQGAGCTNFAEVASTIGTTYSDTALPAGTSFSYRVRAADTSGNLSPYSNTSSATTNAEPPPPDTTPPTAPSNLTATAVSSSQVDLTWTASTDNVGVASYRVERCQGAGCTDFAQVASPAGTTYSDTGLVAATSYSYRVLATDAAGNLSPYSNTSSATTNAEPPPPDTTPPTAPSNLTAAAVSSSQVDLTWTASTDNVGVASYRLERCQGAGCSNFAQVASPTGTTYSDTGLVAATSYSYRVLATDAAGNSSPYSNTASATTSAQPGGLVAAYSFDEGSGPVAADASGNGNTGAISGAAWAAQGRFANALSFDGVDDWVTISDAASLDLTTGMTLEAWVFPTAPGGWRTLVLKEQTSHLAYAMYANTDTDRPSGEVFTTSSADVRGPASLLLNGWTHVAVTYDGAVLVMYINGTPVASRDVSGSIATSAGALRIGGNGVWGEYFQGLIDEIRIYHRALTAGEIQTDMNTPVRP
jgi:chitodextrinase